MPDFRTPWRAVAAMFLLNGALFGIWASRIPAVSATHELDPGSLGLLLLCLAGGAITAFPVAGWAADRHGAATVTRKIAVIYVFALVALALAPGVLSLAALLFFFGATHGAMDVTMNAWAAEVERSGGKPIMSSFHAIFSVGAGVGAATGYVAASNGVGVFAHFAVASACISVPTLLIAAISWQSQASDQKSGGPVFALPKGPLLVVGVIAFCASIGEGAMVDWSAVFLVLVTEADEAQAALGYTVFSVTMVCARLAGDRAVAALGPARAARLSGGAAIAGSLTAVIGGSYVAALIGFGLMGLGYAVIMPLAFSRAANDPSVDAGAGVARVATLGYGGMLLGPPIIGFIAEATSLRIAFSLLSALACLIVLLSGSLASKGSQDISTELEKA